jgi:hydrogenase-4 component B
VTAILISLGLLGGGAATSIALTAKPRAALLVALAAVAVTAGILLITALSILVAAHTDQPVTYSWPMPLGVVRLAIDGLSAWFLGCVAVLSLAVAIYAWPYMLAEVEHGSLAAHGAFLCLLVASLVLVVTAADLVLFLASWEAMSLSAFLLVGFHHRQPEVRRGAWMYLIITHVGTAFFLVPMFGILGAHAHATSFAAFREAFEHCGPRTGALLFVLGLIGFGTKAGFMPMHIWLPVAHPAAPTPVSALLSGVVIKTGIYGILRLLSWLPPLPTGCGMAMLALGIVSGVLGVLYAIAQHDLKRLLAYHSVENIGIIALGIGMGMLGQATGQPVLATLGYCGAMLHVLNHALFKGLLFLAAGTVIHSTGTGEIDRLGGLARRMPVNAALFLIAAVSICGLPPFNGFVSEWILYGSLFGGAFGTAASAAGPAVLGAVSLALMGGLALACFAKVFGVVFLGEARDPSVHVHPTAGLMRVGMSILAASCIAIGMLPGLFVPLTRGGVHAVAHVPPASFSASLQGVIAPVAALSGLVLLLLVLVAGLAIARRRILRRNGCDLGRTRATWGCGYAASSPRVQYTASSFGWSLVESFRCLLWPARHATELVGCFPATGHLESHTPDMAEHDLFAPLARAGIVLCQSIRTVSWPWGSPRSVVVRVPGDRVGPMRELVTHLVGVLRRGSIHACLAFIVLTLLVVFFVGSFTSPRSSSSRPTVADAPRPSEVSK